jgi:hypothetical protein
LHVEALETRNLFSFSSITNYAAGSAPAAVALGDFNNDTRLDLAVANLHDHTVSVLLGKPDGTFGPAVNADTGVSPIALAVGDFNGDDKLDIATVNYGADISILQGNGDGTFQAARSTDLPGGQEPVSVAVGDFNGDGKLDITAAGCSGYSYPGYGSNYDDYANVLLGNGDGSFTSSDAKLVNNNASRVDFGSVAVGDFNGDAKPDLAVVAMGYATILLGNGDGTLQAPVGSTSVASGVAVGDFNADGKPDLAALTYRSLSVSLGNGDGTLQTSKSYDASNSMSVAVGDINADGKLDLVATSYSGDFVSGFTSYVNVLLGYGNGTLAAAQTTTLASGRPNDVALGDLNDDGWIDVVTADYDTNKVTVLVNGGGWILPPPTPRISIGDVTRLEGMNRQTTLFVFTVSLSAAYDQPVTMSFATANGTAKTSGNDYVAKTGTLTFAPGETTKIISIEVRGDSRKEADEYFYLDLFGLSGNAIFTKNRGIGTILNDD